VPTEAGTWMMHCHILEHAEAGMMTTISVIDGT
jgi:FtsP/CotA-like multicopper oxidase with cupredoxin domain